MALDDGTELARPRVASNADANVTFLKLMDPKDLPPDFVASVAGIDYTSASLKINVALSELPDFTRLPGTSAGPQHRGTIHICPRSRLHRTGLRRRQVRPAVANRRSWNARLPAVVDDTLAPPGKHLMSMFVQYAPYKLREGNWDEIKDKFADRCFDILERVRAELQALGDRPAGLDAARPGTAFRPDRRQHLSRAR